MQTPLLGALYTPKGRHAALHAACQAHFGIVDAVAMERDEECDRVRLTAEGDFRTCLFSTVETDLRSGVSDEVLEQIIRAAI